MCVSGGNGDRGWKAGPQAVSVGSQGRGSGDAQGSRRLRSPDKSTTQRGERPAFSVTLRTRSPPSGATSYPRAGPAPPKTLSAGPTGLRGRRAGRPCQRVGCQERWTSDGPGGRGHFLCLHQCSLCCSNPVVEERHRDAQVGQGSPPGPDSEPPEGPRRVPGPELLGRPSPSRQTRRGSAWSLTDPASWSSPSRDFIGAGG